MVRKAKTGLVAAVLLVVSLPTLSFQANAQEGKDSLFRLLRAKSLQMVTPDDPEQEPYRKTIQPVFLHNGTYLECDSAYWYVNQNIIKAHGHVHLKQNGTVLSSQRLDYLVDEDLAQFRGGVVELLDSARNTLRTKILDYNTKDSIAVFSKGGSMKDSDGQIIESNEGNFNSREKTFSFKGNVNMFTDSVFIRTSSLDYHTDQHRAVFNSDIDFWKDENMLSAESGWYDRENETFFFTGNVHGLTENQEIWSDTLYYYKNPGNALMLGRAQVQDSTKGTMAYADYIFYEDSLSRLTMTRNASGAVRSGKEAERDTLYARADTIIYQTFPICTISDAEKETAKTRVENFDTDAVAQYIKKAAEDAAKKAQEAIAKQAMGSKDRGFAAAPAARNKEEKEEEEPLDSAGRERKALQDSLDKIDSIAYAAFLDSLDRTDSTKVGFVHAIHNVLMYRKDLQVKCDSMEYCDLDSVARFYVDPTVWNELRRQYTADSLFLLTRNGRVEKASLTSNAFVATYEDSVHFDQIKGTEIMAYFDSSAALERFDALGGVLAMFYLNENDAIATVNKVDVKMLSGTFLNGQIDRMKYYSTPKNNAYPVAQLPKNELYLKDFAWRDSLRPKDRTAVTTVLIKPSERQEYTSHPRPAFRNTNIYFKGYMDGINKAIERSKLLRSQRKDSTDEEPYDRKKGFVKPSELLARQDSLLALSDSLAAPQDSLLAQTDSLVALADSLGALSDSLNVSAEQAPADSTQAGTTEAEGYGPKEKAQQEKDSLRRAKMEASLAKAALKDSLKAAKWAQLDSLDSLKTAQKTLKALEKKRGKTRRILIKQLKQEAIDAAKLEKYVVRYTKRKLHKDGKHSAKIPEVRLDRHAIKRRESLPAFDQPAIVPFDSLARRAPIDGSRGQAR